MRFLPPLMIALVLALASPASATLSGCNSFTSFNGFDPAIATGGLAKNVSEGLWVPNENPSGTPRPR